MKSKMDKQLNKIGFCFNRYDVNESVKEDTVMSTKSYDDLNEE